MLSQTERTQLRSEFKNHIRENALLLFLIGYSFTFLYLGRNSLKQGMAEASMNFQIPIRFLSGVYVAVSSILIVLLVGRSLYIILTGGGSDEVLTEEECEKAVTSIAFAVVSSGLLFSLPFLYLV
jgi:hypothetical protein